MPSHRILYAGHNCRLPALLHDALKPLDCFVVRCPDAHLSRLFIRSDIKYSLLLFEDSLPSLNELERFAHSLAHRERTPIVIYKESDGLGLLVKIVRRSLDG